MMAIQSEAEKKEEVNRIRNEELQMKEMRRRAALTLKRPVPVEKKEQKGEEGDKIKVILAKF